MTLFNRSNLEVSQVASKSSFDRGLNGLRVNPDGSTVASNGRVLLATGPADRNRAAFPSYACDEVDPPLTGIILPLELVDKAIKSIPSRTKRPQIQYCALSKVKDENRIGVTSVDERGDPTTNVGTPVKEPYPEWENIIRKVRGKKENRHRLCLNRKDLVELLRAMESASPSKGDIPIFLEISEDGVVIRSHSSETGQRTIGVISAMKGKWPKLDSWEAEVMGTPKVRLKARRKSK